MSTAVGGQAVLGGVMMRRGEQWALALRRPDGGIDVSVHATPGFTTRVSSMPVVRGVAALAETLVLGARATIRSSRARRTADLAPAPAARRTDADGVHPAELAAMVVGMAFAVATFGLAPAYVAEVSGLEGGAFHLAEAVLRIGALSAYLWALGRSEAIADVWAYHGAEHQAVNAFEKGSALTVEAVASQSVRHARCGTTFLLLVAMLAIGVHVAVGDRSLPVLLVSRVVALPVITSLAYEVIRVAGRPGAARWLHPLLLPGLLVQSLTTRTPSDAHREVALAALSAVATAGTVPRQAAARPLAGDLVDA